MPINRRQALSLFASTAGLAALPRQAFAQAPSRRLGTAAPAAGNSAPPLVAVMDYEKAAMQRLRPMAREYIIGGAGDEITLRWNREAYDRLALRPRVLAHLKQLDTRVTLFGMALDYPILLAPTAAHKLAHPEGEVATARGASAAGAAMCLSTMSNTAVEDVVKAQRQPVWFQLYVQPDKGYTRELVQRAENAGCKALVVTVDTPVGGARNRQERARFRFPEGSMPHLQPRRVDVQNRSEREILNELLTFNLTWSDIAELRKATRLPVLIKGVLDPEDARIAVREQLDGIVVSNHGARNLDTTPATIEALPRITDVTRGETVVLVDGGIRRGTDVLKALALGANAVQVGRPYLYGLAVNGAAGVTAVMQILRNEFEMAMALCGRDSLKELDRTVLWG